MLEAFCKYLRCLLSILIILIGFPTTPFSYASYPHPDAQEIIDSSNTPTIKASEAALPEEETGDVQSPHEAFFMDSGALSGAEVTADEAPQSE